MGIQLLVSLSLKPELFTSALCGLQMALNSPAIVSRLKEVNQNHQLSKDLNFQLKILSYRLKPQGQSKSLSPTTGVLVCEDRTPVTN